MDLEEERRLVSNSLAKAGHIPAGMELFPATDQDQFEYIKRVIDRSDYYAVITAGRYGSVASDGISFTEKEFDYARSKGIPTLAFLHKDIGSLAADRSEREQVGRDKLKAFDEKLKLGRMVDFWENKHELCTKIVIAVSQSVNLFPGLGWVRGDNAIDPKVLQETERLRAENAELRETLARSRETVVVYFDPSILGPEGEIKLRISEKTPKQDQTRNFGRGFTEDLYTVDTTFKDIFLAIYDSVLKEPAEHTMRGVIGTAFRRTTPTVGGMPKHIYECNIEDVKVVRRQLEALNLIEAKPLQRGDAANLIVWALTEKGRRYAAQNLALRPPS